MISHREESSIAGDIQGARSRISSVFLVTLAIIAIPALLASLSRSVDIGWQPVMAVHIGIVLVLWSMALLRRHVPYRYQAGFIVLMFLLIGFGGILQFGLSAAGTVFLVSAGPIAVLLFGARAGSLTMILSLAGAGTIGWLTISGSLAPSIDVANYVVSVKAWLTALFGWSLAAVALAVSLHAFNKRLTNALLVARQREANLEKVIEERNRTNQALQQALDEIKTLQGIIPICSYCHSIRDDEGAWNEIEKYLSTHAGAQLSHGICPKCLEKVREEMHSEDTE